MVSPTQQRFYGFGVFQVDVGRRLLLRQGYPVSLTPKAFEILLVLIQHRDRVVGKDELMKLVWPDTVVEENNLTRNISSLRKALEEGPSESRFIVTIPGRGNQFAAETQVREPKSEVIFERHARAEVQIAEVQMEEEPLAQPWLAKLNPLVRSIALFIGVSALMIGALGGAILYFAQHRPALPTPVRVADSIAVLPFDTASLDPDL